MHLHLFLKVFVWLLILLVLIVSSANAGGLPIAPIQATIQPPWGQAFALELFKALCRLQPATNNLTSPISVYSALTMVASGARGATLKAMAGTLDADPARWDQVEQRIAAYLAQIDDKQGTVTFQLANALWTARETVLENSYVARMEKQYRAMVGPLPEDDPTGAINDWVNQQTKGKIDRIVDQIDPSLALLLVNAAYFKGAWKTPFPTENTTEGAFHLDDGGTLPVQYMDQHDQFGYLSSEGIEVVRLAYKDPRFCMLVILPPSGVALDNFIDTLTPSTINSLRQRLAHAQGHVVLPRFQLKTGYSLREPLIGMGMAEAFDLEKADFSGITTSSPLAISDVAHRCYLKVDESGSEAAAATAVMMIGTALPLDPPFEFTADRPFLCLIEDQAAGQILFMAAVHRPE